ncbi:polysaccharide deacetylase family protein [Algoriphagus chordae]|uniref:Peptidoglycan/xylan/chitin deacetylase (PgdA/CDA1 family) n=1 Tax=Algoriphagus chordae TaxID=237019 RepID=A0A2W7QN56_9BACT|nr:polysaccharide deacetylase family protein [Algoriphagus chordae]PZX48706.1 peptidoglycan/xylan/chitin deacetylase (PgdA/CDA1 family) [Algoriphagus chordae]
MSKTQVVLVIAILAAIRILLTSISNYYLIALALGLVLFLFGMSMFLRAQFFVESIFKTSENNVLLSFDDGPDPLNTPLILDILNKQGATAMFFLIGKKIKGNEALVQRIHAEGHLLGSHSFSHDSKIGLWNKLRTRTDIAKGHEELLKVVPSAGNWYRPPFGLTNPNIASALKECGFSSVGWSVRSFDTVKSDPKKLLENLSQEIKGSDIVLLHDTQELTVSLLESLIIALKSRNLTLKAELN